MGFFSTITSSLGFGVGTSIGLVVGYYLFIYFQPTDVKVQFFSFYYYSLVYSFFLKFLV